MRKNIGAAIIGILIFLSGLFYLGMVIFDYDIGDILFDGWWTLFIMIPALISILFNKPNWFNLSALCVGVILLLHIQDIITSKDIWVFIIGAVLICIGLQFIISAFSKPKFSSDYTAAPSQAENAQYATPPEQGFESADIGNEPPKADKPENNSSSTGYSYAGYTTPCDNRQNPAYTVVLNDKIYINNSKDLLGVTATGVMGTVTVDLRNTVVNNDIVVNCTAVLGTVNILAPQNVRIRVYDTDILGNTYCTAISREAEAQVPIVAFKSITGLGTVNIK